MRVKKPVCNSAQTGFTEDMGFEPCSKTSIKYGISETPFPDRGRNGGMLSIEQEIQNLFRSLNNERRVTLLGVLGEMVEFAESGFERETSVEGGREMLERK